MSFMNRMTCMELTRRYLPPMPQLTAFESAARLHSFTAAAQELHLTQSAVSRQIRALEDLLGCELFVREKQTVRLSAAGAAYAREVRESLARLGQATLAMRANPQGGVLNLAILPTFGTRWLAPRLPLFLAGHPGVTVNLATRLEPFSFRSEGLDAAIHFGTADWPDAEFEPLMSETAVPACSPQLRRQYRFRKPQDLLSAPLLHVASRPDAWRRWLAAMGVAASASVPGMRVDQFALAAQAAMAGVGVALLPRFLMREEFDQGRLVPAVDAEVASDERYYLVWPAGRGAHPPLAALRQWLRTQLPPG